MKKRENGVSMLQDKKYPDRKIYMNMVKVAGKKKVNFFYYRNNLSIRDFVKCEDKFILNDSYKRYGVNIEIQITVSGNLKNIFRIKSSTTKIRGSLEQFGIVINRVSSKNSIPWEVHIDKEGVKCDVFCQGNYSYAIGKEKSKNKRNMRKKQERRKNKGTRPVKIPKSVSWSISHPFQGGGVSPR